MQSADELCRAWDERVRAIPIAPTMAFTKAGPVLGAGTMLIKRHRDRRVSASYDIDGREQRLLGLLTIAYRRPLGGEALAHIRRACCHHDEGETTLALIHLAYTGLGKLSDPKAAAYRLFLADALLDDGLPPRDLLKACGIDTAGLDLLKAGYDPDEPRVPAGNPDGGQWTDEGIPPIIPAAAHGRVPLEYRTGDPDSFFDTLYAPVHDLAHRLGIDETWLFGLAAYESGWLDLHNRELNDPFGTTYGGGPNVRYDSIASAIHYWEHRYGPVVRGATSAADFVHRLLADRYNVRNKDWQSGVLNTIHSIPRHLSAWKAKRGL